MLSYVPNSNWNRYLVPVPCFDFGVGYSVPRYLVPGITFCLLCSVWLSLFELRLAIIISVSDKKSIGCPRDAGSYQHILRKTWYLIYRYMQVRTTKKAADKQLGYRYIIPSSYWSLLLSYMLVQNNHHNVAPSLWIRFLSVLFIMVASSNPITLWMKSVMSEQRHQNDYYLNESLAVTSILSQKFHDWRSGPQRTWGYWCQEPRSVPSIIAPTAHSMFKSSSAGRLNSLSAYNFYIDKNKTRRDELIEKYHGSVAN